MKKNKIFILIDDEQSFDIIQPLFLRKQLQGSET